jgi:RNA polymerase sigma factor (TIGR02999 family)
MAPDTHEVTRLLQELRDGRDDAAERLAALVYDELHVLASRAMRGEKAGHTLQPTALVHDVFLRLVDARTVEWKSRAHFYGLAAQAMRRVLVDHARRRNALKRDGGVRVTLDDDVAESTDASSIDLIALDDALAKLAALDARQARVVELRFFAGLDVEQTAEALGISPATVKRDWTFAKAFLHTELEGPTS